MIYIILFVGLLVRLISINQSLWLDEATTALASQLSLSDFFEKFMVSDFHPPAYYLAVKMWTVFFGTSEISLRLPSIFFGLLTVYLVFLVSKKLNQRFVWLGPLLLATSGLHVYYSQEARMYSMAGFLVMSLIYFLLNKKWILVGIFSALIFLTDYVSVLVIPALFLYLLFANESKALLKRFIYSQSILLVVFVFWLPTFLRQLQNGIAVKENASGWWNILGPVTLKNILLVPTKFLVGRVSIDNKYLYFFAMLVLGSLLIAVLAKAKDKFLWSVFANSLILGIILSFFIPTLTYFRYLFVLPIFYLLISNGIANHSKNKQLQLATFFVCLNLITSLIYLSNSRFHRENWREIASRIGSSKVVFPNDSQKEALIYYGKADQIISIVSVDNESELWLSRYVFNIFDPQDTTRLKLEKLGYNMSSEMNLNGVVLWKYTKNNK